MRLLFQAFLLVAALAGVAYGQGQATWLGEGTVSTPVCFSSPSWRPRDIVLRFPAADKKRPPFFEPKK